MPDFNIVTELDGMTAGLDFADADDRAAFRTRVSDAFVNAKLSAIRHYVRDLNMEWTRRVGRASSGPARVGQSRADALRHLASDFIIARQLGEL